MSPITLPLILKNLKIVLLCLSIVGLWYVYQDYVSRRKAKEELPQHRTQLTAALARIDLLFSFEHYFSNYAEQAFLLEYLALRQLIVPKFKQLGLPADLVDLISRFVSAFDGVQAARKVYNDDFVRREAEKYAPFFNELEAYPLSREQVEAIIRDDDNNLVIAGAGTGKTTTIAGKVAYILEKKLARPDELLIISFTNNAVQEMHERCLRFCKSIPDAHLLDIRTFNGFGYFVNRSCAAQELHLAFGGDEKAAKAFLQGAFDRLFMENSDFQRKAVNFISFFSRPQRDDFDFETTNDYLNYEKSFQNTTLDGITVKSKEELEIANFFCLNGIQYAYEKHYPLEPEDRSANHAAYYPDFYLPDYAIWHEHYGIDRDGNVPQRFKTKPGFATGKDYYQALIKWKDGIHLKYGTKLIKTYSFENKEGVLLINLKRQLTELGVTFAPRKPEELLELVHQSSYYEDFMNLVFTFLGLLKSNGKTPDHLEPRRKDKRYKVFIQVFKPLFEVYEQHLRQQAELDFNDMVNQAATYCSHGEFSKAYKYILVDEFQDMSLGRYELLKSIRMQNPAVKLYAVGDDWQSIFRFTGSDISIITQFEKHFGYTSQTAILKTHRFNEEILNVSSKFIQRNPAQLKKSLTAARAANRPSFVFIGIERSGYEATGNQISTILQEITSLKPKATVYLIGRYHRNQPYNLYVLQKTFISLKIEYHTAHRVKGMTCDFAILLDLNAGTLGFPSEMADDPLLECLLNEGDPFENAEERRVFYVAITRAKHRNYLLYDATNPSKFVLELNEALSGNSKTTISCPECDGIMVKRNGPFSQFYGCTNYPACEGKLAFAAETAPPLA